MIKSLRILFLSFLLLVGVEAKGQWVTIPDTNFVSWLNNNYPQCMNGNQMDTTCTDILVAPNIVCTNQSINNLFGVKYFKNVAQIFAEYNNLYDLPELPPQLLILYCHHNSITTFPMNFNFPNNLQYFDCSFNQIAVLPPLPPFLLGLWCEGNLLTSLTIPASLTDLNCSGNPLISFPILPSTLNYLTCNNNQLNFLPALPSSLITLKCNNNLFSSLPNLPPNLNWLECENNFLTTLPNFNSLTYNYIYAGNNFLVDIPDLPDTVGFLQLNNNPDLGCLPPFKRINNLNWTGTPINCLPNGSSVGVAAPSLTNVPFCQYGGGCNGSWSIFGYAYEETIANCIKDTNESWVKNIPLKLDSGGITLQTFVSSTQGYYFKTGIGNYQVSIDTAGLPFDVLCPAGNVYNSSISINDSLDADLNFGIQCKSGYVDLTAKSISTSGILRPGVQRTLFLQAGSAALFYGINCATGVSGTVQVVLNNLVTFVSPAPGASMPSTINGDTLTWAITDFSLINAETDFNIIISISTAATGNDVACFQLHVVSNNGDAFPSNNTLTNCFSIRNSFDPNTKEMYPTGILDTSVQEFTFTIFFQNTGNAPAQNIYLIDTLDGNLDANTFQYLSSSHAVIMQLLPGNILHFSYPNINLPDSNSNEPGSHGYVQFKINRNDSLYPNMAIHNMAYIYFDFNPPVVTNDVYAILNIDCNTISDLVISDSSLCDGEMFTAYNNVPFADLLLYTWMLDSAVLFATDPGIALTGIAPGTHTITLISEVLNCNVSSTSTFTVNLKPHPLITSSADTISAATSFNSYQWLMDGATIPGANQNLFVFNQSGWYCVFVTDSNGCSGFSDSTYLLNCNDLISFNISTINICENEIILAANNSNIPGLVNSWMMDSILFSTDSSVFIYGIGPGVHLLTLTVDTLNCTVSIMQPITVYSLPEPLFTILNDTITSASSWNSYQWLLNEFVIPGATQNYYVINQNGYYSLQVTDSNGCTGRSDSIYVSGTGISEQAAADFIIYPNPAYDMIKIMMPALTGKTYEINLSDITGRKLENIFTGKVSSQILDLTIHLENLSKGVYLLRVNNMVKYFVKR